MHKLAEKYPLHRFKNDSQNFEKMTAYFVYTSAKIKGKTYDQVDTDNLLPLKISPGGKQYSDAVMLINLRDGFNHNLHTDNSIFLWIQANLLKC